MNNNEPLYCTLFNAKISSFFGFKINVVEAHHYLIDLSQKQSIISEEIAIKLKATQQEISNKEMIIEIELNSDPISFEKKIDQGGIPSIPQWTMIKVSIQPNIKMRLFDLIIGNDAIFKAKATEKMWNRQIENYKKNKKISKDIF